MALRKQTLDMVIMSCGWEFINTYVFV